MNEQFNEFSGNLTANILEFNTDAIPAPDTLYIYMTRDKRKISNEMRKRFGGFKRVIIDVDGEQHEFGADSLIQMLEDYEDAQGMNNYMTIFGTPEKAARTLLKNGKSIPPCYSCLIRNECSNLPEDNNCLMDDYNTLLEWLRGDA